MATRGRGFDSCSSKLFLTFFFCLIMISFDWYVNTTQYTGILNDNKEHNP